MDMTLLRWPCQLEQVDTLSTIEDWYEIDLERNIALRPTLSDLCIFLLSCMLQNCTIRLQGI